MNFQVRDETYFLGLAEDERRWLFFVSTSKGIRPIPIYVDGPELDSDFMATPNEESHGRPN